MKKRWNSFDGRKYILAAVTAFAAAGVIFACAALAIPLRGENTVDVYNSTVRLRVVANSDSESDQALKLAVRNDIIALAAEIFDGCEDMTSACAAVERNREILQAAAENSVRAHGAKYPVRVSFGTEKCPVRRYSEFTFPAGEYQTLRVDIGSGAGQNWWCVMYPPLCVSAATNEVSADRETFLTYGFSEKQVDALTQPEREEKPTVRFALFEGIKRIFR